MNVADVDADADTDVDDKSRGLEEELELDPCVNDKEDRDLDGEENHDDPKASDEAAGIGSGM